MTPHDANFKQLLRSYLREFLDAFVPTLARQIKPGSVTFLDKELLRARQGRYRRGIVDLVARVQLRTAQGFILVHIEHQGQRQAAVRKRLFFYTVWLMEQYGLPVYPILLTSYGKPIKPEPDRYIVEVLGERILDFHFHVVQLNRLDWRSFARVKNPAAIALMARMRIAPEDRPRVRVQILRLLAQLRLDPRKMDHIAGFVSTYLELSGKEYLAFNAELNKIEDRQEKVNVMELLTEWQRKGRQEGRQEGRQKGERAILRKLLVARFGKVTTSLDRQIRQLNLEDVEELATALLDMTSVSELEQWLAQRRS
jgi:predicted transposase YdaD